MFPEPGQRLGPYEIQGELGGGGMARVYRAWDGRLLREVAIKVIDDRYAMPGIGERFLREARAASGLNHPNICTIFDIGEQDGAPYLVMELMEGQTLKERIESGPMPADEILRYTAEIADALATAHARGIVHRDIKPANIFLVKKKPTGLTQAKVLDFGLAKVERFASEEREFAGQLTSMGATVGTVSYMSPEQARGEQLDARSDLFSLGIIMYEMATGTLPFKGATSALVFVQLLGLKVPDPIRSLNGEIPEELERVVFKLLAKNPKTRFQTALELCDELHDLSESRSGWLTRMKPPPVPPMQALANAPARTGQASKPDLAEAANPKLAKADKSNPAPRVVPSRPGDPQAGRAVARKQRDSPEQPKAEYKRGSSPETPSQTLPDHVSGTRPARSSIATNPRVTYPAVAPYTGHSGAHRTADLSSGLGDGSGTVPADVTRPPNSAPATLSSIRRAQTQELGDLEEKDFAFAGSVSWTSIALIVLLALVIAVLAAWYFGLFGGTLQTRGSLMFLVLINGLERRSTYRGVDQQHE